jgi:hypothetical protein
MTPITANTVAKTRSGTRFIGRSLFQPERGAHGYGSNCRAACDGEQWFCAFSPCCECARAERDGDSDRDND